jgi:hypothetical protein
VQIGVDEAAEDVDHLISPEERLHVAMTQRESRYGSRAQRKPMLPVELSGVFELRAATR